MKVHIVAADEAAVSDLRMVADEVARVHSGRGGDFLIFSDEAQSEVTVVELSRSVARRLSSPRLCDSGRRVLMLEVVAAVLAASSGAPDGEAVH